jgi:hypothetical protein
MGGACQGAAAGFGEHGQDAAGGGDGDLLIDVFNQFAKRRMSPAPGDEFDVAVMRQESASIRENFICNGLIFFLLRFVGVRRADQKDGRD